MTSLQRLFHHPQLKTRRSAFRLLWASSTVSSLGTAITAVALPLTAVITLHATAFEVGLLSAAGTVAWLLFGIVSGVWVDRLRRRPLLVACDLARAIALLSVPLAAAARDLTMGQLLMVAFTVGTGSVFFDVAFQSHVPTVVDDGDLLSANTWLQGGIETTRLAGPGLGGVLVQLLGAPVTLLADVASYLASALCLLSLGNTEERSEIPVQRSGQVKEAREGFSYLWSNPTLRSLALSAASLNVCESAILAVQVVFLVQTLHVRPGLVGVLIASDGAGAVLGAVAAGRIIGKLGNERTIALAVTVGPVVSLLIPATANGPRLLLFAMGSAGLAAFTVVFSVTARVYRQTAVPRNLLGRVTAVNRFISWGVLPLGALLGGALAQVIGTRAALWLIAGLLITMTPVPVLLRPVRHKPDAPGRTPAKSTGPADEANDYEPVEHG